MRIFIYILITVFFVSCSSNELTKEKAAEVIAKKYPKVLDWEIFTADPQHAAGALKTKLEDEGYIRIQKTQSLADAGKPFISFTDKAALYMLPVTESDKKYSIQRVKISELHFKEVVDVKTQPDGKQATVEYTVEHQHNTPFAELSHYKLEGIKKEKAVLMLSDSGWTLAERK
ncbi:hypothetical protein [Chitinophaga hostae]|uniref:Beta-lactamase-inhibitor-like, PepSY-like n=1 Tax=Chitinophaga hostae TaxID=2831022 RepID=A0ABS5IVW8_9BACT|nr:hypothetical protein [Chitinophaga hostae]MBS0027095.1 hypothetical protein [Chitinophaga hostae]